MAGCVICNYAAGTVPLGPHNSIAGRAQRGLIAIDKSRPLIELRLHILAYHNFKILIARADMRVCTGRNVLLRYIEMKMPQKNILFVAKWAR